MRLSFIKLNFWIYLFCCSLTSVIYSCNANRSEPKDTSDKQEVAGTNTAVDSVVDLKVSNEDLLIGTWTSSIFISPGTFAAKSEEKIPEGVSMEMTAEVTSTYHLGNKFDASGEITMRITNTTNNSEVPLRFYYKEAGTWKIYDETLVETTEDGVLTPLDDVTKSVIDQTPELAASIRPIRGQSTSTKIISINETTADMEELEQHLKYTMRKKQ